MNLLPMDFDLFRYLVECGGSAPTIAIPAKIFRGEIPDDATNLTEFGLIRQAKGITSITDLGRSVLLTSPNRSSPNSGE
jgi:hypothetical protein